jgi:hypothetical protein
VPFTGSSPLEATGPGNSTINHRTGWRKARMVQEVNARYLASPVSESPMELVKEADG